MNLDETDSLASRIRDGDRFAFRQFYNLYSRKVYGFALTYLKSKSEAEEIIQAVFVKIWETRTSIQDNLSLKSYLYKITVNHIYNYIKFKKVRSGNVADGQEEPDNTTLENIYFNSLQENVNNLIEQLPEQRKLIFKLSRQEGLSYDQIAAKMQISVRTVENQVYKALKYLKKHLKEDLNSFLFFML
jgi:RNA polymerase sigma-70 factor (ECF subfamily)